MGKRPARPGALVYLDLGGRYGCPRSHSGTPKGNPHEAVLERGPKRRPIRAIIETRPLMEDLPKNRLNWMADGHSAAEENVELFRLFLIGDSPSPELTFHWWMWGLIDRVMPRTTECNRIDAGGGNSSLLSRVQWGVLYAGIWGGENISFGGCAWAM